MSLAEEIGFLLSTVVHCVMLMIEGLGTLSGWRSVVCNSDLMRRFLLVNFPKLKHSVLVVGTQANSNSVLQGEETWQTN